MFHHGGNLKSAMLAFAGAPQPWIDLSTGINPVPYPLGHLPAAVWTRLPEAADIAGLEALAALAWGAAPAARIVAAPGTQALIQWLPRLFPARRVGILDFTYAEHAQVWRAAGAQVESVASLAELAGFDVAVIVNPNNPDGRLVPAAGLAALAAQMAQHGGLLVVDEAFADVLAREASLVPRLTASCAALILRSFGKTWGLAGLRLGFAVAAPELATKIRIALGPWAVSGPALAIGAAALADNAWLAQSTARLTRDAARLDALLAGAGFTGLCGTPLFRLGFHRNAARWFRQLGQAGILVRPFAGHPDRLRFGLPGAGDWDRLADCLNSPLAGLIPDAPPPGRQTSQTAL